MAATALFTGDRHKFIIGESESFLTSLWQQHHYQNDRQLVFFFVICRWVYLSFTPTEFNIMTFCSKIKPKVIIQFSFLSSRSLANRNLFSPHSDSSTIIKMIASWSFSLIICPCVYLSFAQSLISWHLIESAIKTKIYNPIFIMIFFNSIALPEEGSFLEERCSTPIWLLWILGVQL